MKPFVGSANLLAGQAVAHAEAFLDGRTQADITAERAVCLLAELNVLKGMQVDALTRSIVDATFILTIALRNAATHASRADDASAWARFDRWRQAVTSLAEHVRKESLALTEEGHIP